MCQPSTKISGRLNIMLISTTMQLHCNWLSWMQVQQRGWCSRDPTYTTKQKWHFQILTYYKTAKISTQGVSKIPCSDAEPPLRPAHLHLDTHEEFTNFDFQAPLKTARWGIFCEIIIIWRKFYTMSDLYSRIAELTSKKESTPRQQMSIPDNTFVIFNHLRNANLSAKKRNSWLETT